MTELGFVVEPLPIEQPQNQFQVRFVGPATRVIVEGRAWGESINVKLERLAGRWSHLTDILALRSPDSAAPFFKFGDQRVLLRYAASMMRQHALDALRGEPDIFQAAETHRQKMIEMLQSE
jgi:hypothetical protein